MTPNRAVFVLSHFSVLLLFGLTWRLRVEFRAL